MLNLNRLRAFVRRFKRNKDQPVYIGTYGREALYMPKGTKVIPVSGLPSIARNVAMGEVRIVVHNARNIEEIMQDILRDFPGWLDDGDGAEVSE